MAMPVYQRLGIQLRGLEMNLPVEIFGKRKRLFLQLASARLFRKKVGQLVAKYRAAARLEHDHGRGAIDFRTHRVENVPKIGFRLVKEAVVVQRAPATEMMAGNQDVTADG